MNLTDRLITEIVGKCDGLSITAEQASNILAYLQYGATMDDVRRDAERYRKLRGADINAVHEGGVFACLTPDNVVINGEDLDIAVDLLIDGSAATTPQADAAPSADGLPPLPAPIEIDWPELHSQALGCGVEDRNIRDRYEAAEYGWQDGVDRAAERVPEEIFTADQMREYARAAIAAGGAQEPVALPAGWKLIRVNEHFDALIEALERAESKGYLPDAMADEWANFACDEKTYAAPLPREAATIRLAALKDAENIARLFDLGTPDGHAIADAIRKLAAASNGDTR